MTVEPEAALRLVPPPDDGDEPETDKSKTYTCACSSRTSAGCSPPS